MDPPAGHVQKTVDLEGRRFSLHVQRFENGFFVSVAEGPNRLGPLVASLATGPSPVTTTVIPSRSESLFLKLAAEQISTRTRGIALVSASVQKDLDPRTAKALMSEIMELVRYE